MYKYFEQLDKKEFKLYLKEFKSEKENNYIVNAKIPINFFIKYKDLFKKISFIDKIIKGSNEKLFLNQLEKLSYEQYDNIGSFFSKKYEEYYDIEDLNKEIEISSRELENLLTQYLIYCNLIMNIYPNFKKFICTTKENIKSALTELKQIKTIQLPKSNDGVIYEFPYSWYITPSGYLYNTGTGHKEGNLVNSFLLICDILKANRNIPNINYYDKIITILKNGYITSNDFKKYANLYLLIPTIFTPEIEKDIEVYNKILKMSEEERIKYSIPHYQRSYQRNIVTLIIGYLSAKSCFFESFNRLNTSTSKKEIITKLSKLDLDEIFVRFSGFHKVSSVCDKTITTSSIESIEKFKEYLDKGWTLDVIPGIIYDKYNDKLVEQDFNSYYISKYLDEILEKNEGKGKILIKGK